MDKPKESKTEENAGTPAELSEKELDQVAGGIEQPTTTTNAGRIIIKVPIKKPGAGESLCSNCG